MKTLQVTKKTDYTGYSVYVGIDVHGKQWTVTVMTDHKEHKTFVQSPPSGEKLYGYLSKHFPGGDYRSVYEAGFSGFSVHDRLEDAGLRNIVINPADVPSTDRERKRKQDKVDSRKLCDRLRKGQLKGIYIPTVAERYEKESVRLRKRLVGDITRCKNRVKSYLWRSGIEVPEEMKSGYKSWSKKFRSWLEEQGTGSPLGQATLKALLSDLKSTERIKLELERKIISGFGEKYREELELLRSIPGMGMVTRLTLLSEVGDTSRFPDLDSLLNFVGLVPDIHGSGDHPGVGRMTGRKNKYLLSVLIEGAWSAVGKDPSLLLSYEKLCKRMTGNKGVIRICRKLLSRARHVLLKKEKYEYMLG